MGRPAYRETLKIHVSSLSFGLLSYSISLSRETVTYQEKVKLAEEAETEKASP